MKKAILHLRNADPVLRDIIDRVGPPQISYRDPEFATLVRAIVYQQLNGVAASTIFGRFLALVDGVGLTPEAVLKLPLRKLRAAGLSQQKITYIRDLAKKAATGAIRFDLLPAMSDDEVIAALTQVKGVGVWTAHMFLIFALRRPDVLAVGDYGIRAAVKSAYGLDELPKPAEMERIARPWRPYCSLACWYLWRSVEKP